MDLPASDAQSSSRSFFLFLFSALDSCCLFEAIFEKFTKPTVKVRQATEIGKGTHGELAKLSVYLFIYLFLGGGTIVTFFEQLNISLVLPVL